MNPIADAPSVTERAVGLLLLVLAVAIFAGSVLRVPLLESVRLDLQPSPDAEEYLAGAVSLHRYHEFVIELAGQRLPPRYPFGYSLLMVPWLAAGVTPVNVPFLVNDVVGLASILGLFAALWRRRPLAAGISVALLASWPAFIVACRSPLSEPSAAATVLLAFWGLVAFASGGPVAGGMAGAAMLGVSVWFRVANIFLIPILFLAPLCLRASWRTRARSAALLAVAFAIGLSPLLWYNLHYFGSPFRTGYSYWVPYWAVFGNAFRFSRLWRNGAEWWNDARGGAHAYSTADIYGMGSYQSRALVVVMLLTVVTGLRRRADWAAAAAVSTSVISLLFYVSRDARLLFPALLVAVPFVGREVAVLLARARDGRPSSRIVAAVAGMLVVASVVGYPRQGNRFGLDRAFDVEPLRGPSGHYTLVQQLDLAAAGQPALVLADINPAYVSALAAAHHVVMPLLRTLQPFREPLLVADADIERQIQRAIAENRHVFFLNTNTTDLDVRRLATPPSGYGWNDLYSAGHARLAQLALQPETP